jgi:hypothetical protein
LKFVEIQKFSDTIPIPRKEDRSAAFVRLVNRYRVAPFGRIFESEDVDRDVLKPIVDIVVAAAVYNGFLEAFRQVRFDTQSGFQKVLSDLDKRRNKVVEYASLLARLYAANYPLENLADDEVQKILNL